MKRTKQNVYQALKHYIQDYIKKIFCKRKIQIKEKPKIANYYTILIVIITTIIILILPINTIATGLGEITAPNPAKVRINVIIERFINFALSTSIIVFLLIFIWASIDWITSGGEKGKLEQAKNRITAAMIGIIILACIFAAMQIIRAISYDPYANPNPPGAPPGRPPGDRCPPPGCPIPE